jgi:hypothetical protein
MPSGGGIKTTDQRQRYIRHEIILMPSGGGIKTTNQRGRYILTFSIL